MIATEPTVADAPAAAYPTTLPLAKIRPGKNPRRYFDRTKHDELVVSFRLRGMLQPMLLRPVADADDVFEIVAGERRYKAALEAFGHDGEAPVTIRVMTDQEALEAAIDENDCRDDASETEQADAAVRALAASQGDRAEAAKRLGWSASKLDRRLALANLSETVKTALDERRIKVGHAELLAAVPADKQDQALATILSSGIDVAKTRELLMRVTQDLVSATFDKTECATCPFNSASQTVLFEAHVDAGSCTNKGCFQLKTEAAAAVLAEEQERAAPKVKATEPPAAGGGEGAPIVPAEAGKPAAPAPAAKPAAKPASGAAPAAKPKVTAQALAAKLEPNRKAAWRNAVAVALSDSADHLRVADIAAGLVRSGAAMGFDEVRKLAAEFEVDLRTTWRVDGTFLALLTKDELKFLAQECGLVAHMGEKAFAKLLAVPVQDLISGVLHATGFDWAGRLPSAITLDGKYSPPPEATIADATSASEKD